jgi:hypothetical protein
MGAGEVILDLQSARHGKYHKMLYSDIKQKGRYAYNKYMCECPYLRTGAVLVSFHNKFHSVIWKLN